MSQAKPSVSRKALKFSKVGRRVAAISEIQNEQMTVASQDSCCLFDLALRDPGHHKIWKYVDGDNDIEATVAKHGQVTPRTENKM